MLLPLPARQTPPGNTHQEGPIRSVLKSCGICSEVCQGVVPALTDDIGSTISITGPVCHL